MGRGVEKEQNLNNAGGAGGPSITSLGDVFYRERDFTKEIANSITPVARRCYQERERFRRVFCKELHGEIAEGRHSKCKYSLATRPLPNCYTGKSLIHLSHNIT